MTTSDERQLDDWIESFVEWTEKSESPELYRRWTAISCIAAALQRKCSVNWGSIVWYPNMYIVLVGPSGCRKGTAMKFGWDLLAKTGIKLSAQSTTRQALIRRLREANKTDQDHVSGDLMQHSSLTVFSEEFTVFLGYGQRELIADLCDWYDCKELWVYDTKNVGTDSIPGVWLNVIGATTPKLIRTSLPDDSIGGGLTSRIVFVYEPQRAKKSVLPIADPELGTALGNDLEKINLIAGQFKVTREFFEGWSEWYLETEEKTQLQDEIFDGYNNRRPTHVMKMSMIHSASRKDGNRKLDIQDLERSIATLSATEAKMPMTFQGFGQSDIAGLLQRVITLLAIEGEIYVADLLIRLHRDADRLTLDRVIRTLETMGAVRMLNVDQGGPKLKIGRAHV